MNVMLVQEGIFIHIHWSEERRVKSEELIEKNKSDWYLQCLALIFDPKVLKFEKPT